MLLITEKITFNASQWYVTNHQHQTSNVFPSLYNDLNKYFIYYHLNGTKERFTSVGDGCWTKFQYNWCGDSPYKVQFSDLFYIGSKEMNDGGLLVIKSGRGH